MDYYYYWEIYVYITYVMSMMTGLWLARREEKFRWEDAYEMRNETAKRVTLILVLKSGPIEKKDFKMILKSSKRRVASA